MDTKILLYVGIGAGIALALALLVVLLRARAKRKETQREVDDRLREEALDRVLTGGARRTSRGTAPQPFEVRYDQQKGKGAPRAALEQQVMMVQLTERSELSTRRYMLNIVDRVTFGGQASVSDIVTPGVRADLQCEIFRIGHDLYLRNLDPARGQVQLRRRNTHTNVGQDGMKLEDRDSLLLGSCAYDLEFVKG